jgi:hypothetical protein
VSKIVSLSALADLSEKIAQPWREDGSPASRRDLCRVLDIVGALALHLEAVRLKTGFGGPIINVEPPLDRDHQLT